MLFCPNREAKCLEKRQLLDAISSTVFFIKSDWSNSCAQKSILTNMKSSLINSSYLQRYIAKNLSWKELQL